MTEKEKKPLKTYDLNPPHRLPYEKGQLLTNRNDLYYTSESDVLDPALDEWHGAGGEAEFMPKGSCLMFVDQAQFTAQGKAYIRMKVLCGERAGWVTVTERSLAKEWSWLIPMKQKKLINKDFDDAFTLISSPDDLEDDHETIGY